MQLQIDIMHYAILGFAGLVLGSFFNVMIWRIPRGESIVWPPSHCTGCGKNVKAFDNIPVLGYLILGGKCRFCKARISAVYPIVEALTAVSLIVLWQLLGITPKLLDNPWHQNILPLVQIASLVFLIPISVIDIRHYIIPDRFSLTFLALGLAVSFIPGGITPVESLLGALAGGGTLFAMGLIGTYIMKKGDAMGLGDVKMMAYMGALWGYKAALFGIAFGAFFGSVAGGVMILTKKLNDEHRIPFGPFLGLGTVAAIFVGDTFFNWYMGLFNG